MVRVLLARSTAAITVLAGAILAGGNAYSQLDEEYKSQQKSAEEDQQLCNDLWVRAYKVRNSGRVGMTSNDAAYLRYYIENEASKSIWAVVQDPDRYRPCQYKRIGSFQVEEEWGTSRGKKYLIGYFQFKVEGKTLVRYFKDPKGSIFRVGWAVFK